MILLVFFGGMLVGAAVGMTIMAMACISGRADEESVRAKSKNTGENVP